MKEVLAALSSALGRPVSVTEFRSYLSVFYHSLDHAADAFGIEVAAETFSEVLAEDRPGAAPATAVEQPGDGQPLPGGQHLFESPPAGGLGTCPECGSAIVEAATATDPAVCLACGPLTKA